MFQRKQILTSVNTPTPFYETPRVSSRLAIATAHQSLTMVIQILGELTRASTSSLGRGLFASSILVSVTYRYPRGERRRRKIVAETRTNLEASISERYPRRFPRCCHSGNTMLATVGEKRWCAIWRVSRLLCIWCALLELDDRSLCHRPFSALVPAPGTELE